MKKILTWLILLLFATTTYLSVQSVNAFAGISTAMATGTTTGTTKGTATGTTTNTPSSNKLKINSTLTNWVLDDTTNTLYAISESDKLLYLINATTLQLDKTITLNGNPTDITADNGNVFVAIDKSQQIAVVNTATKKIERTLNTTSDPKTIVVDGTKLYYSEYDQWCHIYEYDLAQNTDKVLTVGLVYQPDLAINKDKHLLYIGESASSGSNMIYYSINKNKVVSKTNYNHDYGFPYPDKSVLFDGGNVFYGNRAFDNENANKIIGKYDGEILLAKNGYVFTNKNIYNKNSYSIIGSFNDDVSLVELSNKSYLYTYNDKTGIITKSSQNATASEVSRDFYPEKFNSTLTNMVLDQSSNTIGAISENGRDLYLVNAKTLKIEKGITLNSNPTDIIADNGKLYVALDDIHQIVVVDIASRKIINTLYTTSDPYRIVKDGNKIYYTEFDQWCYVYEYDLDKNVDNKLQIGSFYKPDLAINNQNHLLYIGESGSSGSNMTYYSIMSKKVVSKTNFDNGYGFSYPSRITLFDGTNVFYAGRSFDKDNATKILGQYNSNIIFAKNGYVFTNENIYNRDSHSIIATFDQDVTLVELSSKSSLYTYNNEKNVITNSIPDKKAPVVSGVVNGASYNHNVTIDFNEGTATLDGKPFTKGGQVTSQGKHVLVVADLFGNSTTVIFTIDLKAPIGVVQINYGAKTTTTSIVNLNIFTYDELPSSGIGYILVSNSADFKGATWTPYAFNQKWKLSSGYGTKEVYVKIKDKAGNVSETLKSEITLTK